MIGKVWGTAPHPRRGGALSRPREPSVPARRPEGTNLPRPQRTENGARGKRATDEVWVKQPSLQTSKLLNFQLPLYPGTSATCQ